MVLDVIGLVDSLGRDRIRDVLFTDANERWHWVRVTHYIEFYYLSHVDGDAPGLEARPGGEVAPMDPFGAPGRVAARRDPDNAWEPRRAQRLLHWSSRGASAGRRVSRSRRFADGRHEGLLDIDEDSTDEFGDWIDGTHPKRSGWCSRYTLRGLPIGVADPEGVRKRWLTSFIAWDPLPLLLPQ